jgi:hypothetical protein
VAIKPSKVREALMAGKPLPKPKPKPKPKGKGKAKKKALK